MPSTVTVQATKSARLLDVLSAYDEILIVAHDNPDPDSIAAGWGIFVLVEERLKKPVRLIAGGAIVRAENRHMVDLLQPPIELVNDVEVDDGAATVLIDCHVGANNHLLTRKNIQPIAVIDHHTNGTGGNKPKFYDVRPEVAASVSIVADYMRQQEVEPQAKLATAMLYAIRTETSGFETYHSPLDRDILPWLTERAEPELLADIANAPLTRTYFGDLMLAMQNTFTYDDVGLCFLPRADGPEVVGEVADLLIRCEGVRRVLCGAIINDDLLFSARTEPGCGNAAMLLRTTLEGLGGCGGHEHRAGGKIANVGHGQKIAEQLNAELRERWLAACGVNRQRGTRLVPRREIVENL